MLTTLTDLNEEDLIHVLTEPKNALIKHYRALFDLDHIELTFTDEAIQTVAHRAVSMKTGARALRSILEKVMLELMYDTPALEGVKEVVITKEVIEETAQPQLLRQSA